jgi:hypothetical protein
MELGWEMGHGRCSNNIITDITFSVSGGLALAKDTLPLILHTTYTYLI